jgi:HK97 gp10 family phage protein
MAIDVKITDNSGEFLDALSEQIEQALTAIGLTAESYAKRDCPVDTGRLRNSITNAVRTDEKAVYIGSNVEYAAYVELGTTRMKARPYLKPAATEHSAEYKSLAEQALKGG